MIEFNMSELIKYFPYTNNESEAGYLMKDGKMLDFSGKTQGGTAGQRIQDHREISQFLNQEKLNEEEKDFLKKTDYNYIKYFGLSEGAIRVDFSNNSQDIQIDIFQKPTEKQLDKIREVYKNKLGYIFADINYKNKGGDYDNFNSFRRDL